MKAPIKALLGHQSVQACKPAPDAEILRLEERLQTALPPVIKNLWQQSNGFVCHTFMLEFLNIQETFRMLEYWYGDTAVELLPIFNLEFTSDYLAVYIQKPLAPRVVLVSYRGEVRLLYRNLNRLLKTILNCLVHNLALYQADDFNEQEDTRLGADIFFHETDGDYAPAQDRTLQDLRLGEVLFYNQSSSWDRQDQDLGKRLLGS